MKALIFEGNTDARNVTVIENGNIPYHQLFMAIIQNINATIVCDVAFPTRADYTLMTADQLQQYDYVLWTGSSLNAYDTSLEVTNQIEQAKIVFQSGVPFYGSCWGLQIAVMASGGTVEPNKKGTEVGVAKNITVTEAGKNHPMFKGRDKPFGSFCVHNSETTQLPENAVLLASNDHSQVQALEINWGGGTFWGVQYHPEFDKHDSQGSIRRNRIHYEQDGIIDKNTTAEHFISEMMVGHEGDLTDDSRLTEIRNFIEHFAHA